MKQKNITKAYVAIQKFFNFRLPVKKAKAIFQVASKMEVHFNFSVNEERKYVEDFDGKINEDGTVSFKNLDNFKAFQLKMQELDDLDVDLDIQPIILSEDDIGDQKVSVSDMRDLDGIVIFE